MTEWLILPVLFLTVASLAGLFGLYLMFAPRRGFGLLVGRRLADSSTMQQHQFKVAHRLMGLVLLLYSATTIRFEITYIRLKTLVGLIPSSEFTVTTPTLGHWSLDLLELAGALTLTAKSEAVADWLVKKKPVLAQRPSKTLDLVFLGRWLGIFLATSALLKLIAFAQ